MTTRGDERGLTEGEYAAMLPAIVAARVDDLNAQFADMLPPGTTFAWVAEAMTRPAPGYREIANEGGARWHARIAEDDDDDPR